METKAISPSKFGLKPHHFELLNEVVFSHSKVRKAWVFGSRALGTYKDSSDIDIALEGEMLDLSIIAELAFNLEQSSLPFKVDLVVTSTITTPELLEHIREHGVRVK
ncbi:nucleotidyltransferase family protein [Vibrio maerlii]|uniref:nucleotidyltransferase family protein n=1 Tax=Vibrio maerlii TaxID=2231648 RepID=UPI000E3CA2B6|nr:nucleotidyltransferase domain-containing protein [Vibrio maerlii]